MTTRADQGLKQARENLKAYEEHRAELEAKHLGKTVLLRNCRLVEIFDDYDDAFFTGCEKYGLGSFSVQLIGERAACFGAMTPYI